MDELPSEPELFSVPRRFDLATILVAMTAAAILFGGMTLLNFETSSFAVIAGLFAAVAVGQAVGARANRPRAASIIASVIYWVAIEMVRTRVSHENNTVNLCSAPITAALTGYLAGVLVAGVFLVSHRLRGALKLGRRRGRGESGAGDSPWDEPA